MGEIRDMVAFIHIGEHGCGKPALLMNRAVLDSFLTRDVPLNRDQLAWPDGSKVRETDIPACGSCGIRFELSSSHLRPDVR